MTYGGLSYSVASDYEKRGRRHATLLTKGHAVSEIKIKYPKKKKKKKRERRKLIRTPRIQFTESYVAAREGREART